MLRVPEDARRRYALVGTGDERLQDDLLLPGVAANTSVAAGGGWVALPDLLGGCAP